MWLGSDVKLMMPRDCTKRMEHSVSGFIADQPNGSHQFLIQRAAASDVFIDLVTGAVGAASLNDQRS